MKSRHTDTEPVLLVSRHLFRLRAKFKDYFSRVSLERSF